MSAAGSDSTSTTGRVAGAAGRLAGTTIMAIGCGTPDGEVNNGFAAVTAFLREGARVCIVDRDPRALDEAAKELGEMAAAGIRRVDGPGTAGHLGEVDLDTQLTTVVADVGDEASVEAAFAHCADRLGGPTVLHYNVGIVVNGGVDTLDADGFRRALDINLTGPSPRSNTPCRICAPRAQGRSSRSPPSGACATWGTTTRRMRPRRQDSSN